MMGRHPWPDFVLEAGRAMRQDGYLMSNGAGKPRIRSHVQTRWSSAAAWGAAGRAGGARRHGQSHSHWQSEIRVQVEGLGCEMG